MIRLDDHLPPSRDTAPMRGRDPGSEAGFARTLDVLEGRWYACLSTVLPKVDGEAAAADAPVPDRQAAGARGRASAQAEAQGWPRSRADAGMRHEKADTPDAAAATPWAGLRPLPSAPAAATADAATQDGGGGGPTDAAQPGAELSAEPAQFDAPPDVAAASPAMATTCHADDNGTSTSGAMPPAAPPPAAAVVGTAPASASGSRPPQPDAAPWTNLRASEAAGSVAVAKAGGQAAEPSAVSGAGLLVPQEPASMPAPVRTRPPAAAAAQVMPMRAAAAAPSTGAATGSASVDQSSSTERTAPAPRVGSPPQASPPSALVMTVLSAASGQLTLALRCAPTLRETALDLARRWHREQQLGAAVGSAVVLNGVTVLSNPRRT